MNNIQDVMNFFSELTQKTLSAFHLSNNDDTIYDEVESIKRLLTNVVKKKIVTVTLNDDNTYTRYFIDGTSDNVDFNDVMKVKQWENTSDYQKIKDLLDKPKSNIVNLKLSKDIPLVDWKETETPTEKLMFYIKD